ncbi:MAG: response regulator [Saprospiraceae bacterium]|nr:response regulator [Saprospiraceae bacterium]
MENIRILIVEDEPIIAADLADRLTDMGFDIAGLCDTGEEALVLVQRRPPDLILMDIQLAGPLDGIETTKLIMEKHAIPVVFLSSNSDDATFARAKTTLPAAFLSKPFRGRDLKNAIELAIHRGAVAPGAPATAEADQAYLFEDRMFIKSKDRMVRLFFRDILWLEADDYYCKLVLNGKEILITQTLKHMGETLAAVPELMRVHRSYIVNLAHVEEIGDLYLYIANKQIPINKAARDEILTRVKKI